MKFRVISRPRRIQQGLTSAMLQASREILNRHIKSGTDDCIYLTPDGGYAGVAIFNADSGEALADLFAELPTSPFVEYETRPLADFNKVIDKLIGGMKSKAFEASRRSRRDRRIAHAGGL